MFFVQIVLKCLLVCVWTDSCLFLLVFSRVAFLSFCVYLCACACVCFHCELFICPGTFFCKNSIRLGLKVPSSREDCSSFTQGPGVSYQPGVTSNQIF